ncbi:hypothetical protein VB737_13470 [Synechococcus sp. BA-120 BA3]|nr:hypothetical protein [Synechococcus sp. BA-120 BA3]
MNFLRSPISWLGASRADLAKSALLAAAVLGGSLLAGGAAQASGRESCFFGGQSPTCVVGGPGWTLGDKNLILDQLPAGTADEAILGEIVFNWISRPNPDDSSPYEFDDWDIEVDFDNPLTNSTGSFEYTLSVIDSESSWFIDTVRLDSDIEGTGPFDSLVTKDIIGDGGVVVPSIESRNGNPSDTVPIGPFRTIKVTDTWSTCESCSIDSFNNTYAQSQNVPGPLPLLGVGAAFGYSRRLRNRLKVHTEA